MTFRFLDLKNDYVGNRLPITEKILSHFAKLYPVCLYTEPVVLRVITPFLGAESYRFSLRRH